MENTIDLLSYAEAADLLKINVRTIYTRVSTDPTFPKPVKLCGKTYLIKSDLAAYIDSKISAVRRINQERLEQIAK